MRRRSLALAGIAALVLMCAAGQARAQDSVEATQVAADDVAVADDQSGYEVPLLGIGSFRRGAETELQLQRSGGLANSPTAVYVKPLKGGETQVRVRFHNLRQPENGARYVLWAVGPDKTYTRLGQVESPDRRLTAKIEARTALRDFGLFITAETGVATGHPSGPVAAMIVR